MIDIIRHKQVSLNDLQEGEYVINEFAGQVKGVLKLNNKLHTTIFNEESNKAPLKSEQNNIVVNDGISDRVIIGDIGKTKDGKLYGIKVSTPGYDARFAPKTNLLLDSSTSIDFSYEIISHNMQADINTDETFLPWFGIKQASDLTGVSSSFLAPYSMTLKKIMFRAPTISTNPTADLAIKLYKMDDGDAVNDVVARATHQDELVANTFFVVNKSDFDNNPKFEMGDNCGISIEAVQDYGSSINWKITSVWETEVVL
jgi:hypothetical protein